jgi:hypothetical protein
VGSHPVESLPGEQSLTLFERLEESGHFNKRLFEGAYVEPREAGPKRIFELAGIGWFELGGNPWPATSLVGMIMRATTANDTASLERRSAMRVMALGAEDDWYVRRPFLWPGFR